MRGAVLRRWVAVGALALVALLYYRPLRAYMDARAQRAERVAAVRRLQSEQAALEKRLQESSSLAVLEQEARALGYVRKGEHLYIVKNVAEWRAHKRAGHTPRRGH
ncbi:MAG: septum formation initiator family protein [Actinobacteria bacterium]|nr:septum formation initiator family protein [Actinomycetota bacterium]MBV8562880.1 septum formation initiator family protein [Actinomycetota bacterium]